MQDGSLYVSIPCTATITLSLLGASDPAGAPHVLAVEPGPAKPGAVVTAIGRDLDRDSVAGVFLSDRHFDWEAEVVAQSENVLRFRIPEFTRDGAQRLLLLSARGRRTLIEQSVTIEVR